MDDESANVGAMTAEFLDIPHVSQISRLSMLDTGRAEVENDIEGGKKVLEITLPALFTAQKGLNEPRVPLITGVMKAMKTEITVIDPASFGTPFGPIDNGSSRVQVLSYELPATRPSVRIIEGETPEEKAKGLVKALKDEAKAL
jgi:electron transfer flavoprotein beta subunit